MLTSWLNTARTRPSSAANPVPSGTATTTHECATRMEMVQAESLSLKKELADLRREVNTLREIVEAFQHQCQASGRPMDFATKPVAH